MKVGIIGLDTSHVEIYANLLNNPEHQNYIGGATIVVAYAGEPSMDFELSYGRIDRYTNMMREKFGITLVDSCEEVAEACDAIIIASVDGRVHLSQFAKVSSYQKPVFIDKPLTIDSKEADQLFRLAETSQTAVMSSSALYYSEVLTEALQQKDTIIGADFYGSMPLEPTQPGFFWYGIHSVSMLYQTMGKGCLQVQVTANEDHDMIVGLWENGRIGTVRGNRQGSNARGGVIHRKDGSTFIDTDTPGKSPFVSLMEEMLRMFQSGKTSIDSQETVEMIRFIEAANESSRTGKCVLL